MQNVNLYTYVNNVADLTSSHHFCTGFHQILFLVVLGAEVAVNLNLLQSSFYRTYNSSLTEQAVSTRLWDLFGLLSTFPQQPT